MGDPRKIRKKYSTPAHPWQKERIEIEKRLAREYGTANKKEIWKMDTLLSNYKNQAKKLVALRTAQADVERNHLFRKVRDLGLIPANGSEDDILGLTIDSIMGRRLQTILQKKGLARTVKQARQFIVHEHVMVNNRKITAPSYLVTLKEESTITFSSSSALFREDHPERLQPETIDVVSKVKEVTAKEPSDKKVTKIVKTVLPKIDEEDLGILPDDEDIEVEK